MAAITAVIGSLASTGLSAASQFGAAKDAKKAGLFNALAILKNAKRDVEDEKENLSRLAAENRAATAASGQGAAGSPIAVNLQNVFDSIKAQKRIMENAKIAAAGGIQQANQQAKQIKMQAIGGVIGGVTDAFGLALDAGLFNKKGGTEFTPKATKAKDPFGVFI